MLDNGISSCYEASSSPPTLNSEVAGGVRPRPLRPHPIF